MDFSLSDSTAKTVQVNICKIAFKTIPRCGISTLFLLCIGLYCLFLAGKTFQQIQIENHTPYVLSAITDSDNLELDTLLEIEDVEKISPVLNLDASLLVNEYKLDCEIVAVYNSFLSLRLTKGTIYPNSSNMPCLVLNKAAAKGFLYEQQVLEVSIADSIVIETNGTERKAVVCGIFDDNNENPTVYMSYEVALKEYGTGSQNKLLFLLKNWRAAKRIVPLLKTQNIYSNVDSMVVLYGELLQKECIQISCLSISIIACCIVLIKEKRKMEIHTNKNEVRALLASGMTERNIKYLYWVRIILIQLICLCISAVCALITGFF